MKKHKSIITRTAEELTATLNLSPGDLRDGSCTIEHVRMSLANKMLARRKAAGLTQARLARLARVRIETISRLENGLHMPGPKTFDRIDRALTRAAKRPAA